MSRFGVFDLVIFGTLVFSQTVATGESEKHLPTGNEHILFGDPKWCSLHSLKQNVIGFEVLPGGGWDNLRNKDGGFLVKYNYSSCKTSDDGKFLIPDELTTIPIKSSKLETYAELFDHWSNYKSTTSTSINVEAGLHLGIFGISGKFSHESESVRSRQYSDESVTTRIQLRYTHYAVRLRPDTALDDVFKSRLLRIASHIQGNHSGLANYESQLLVRDFGTHVVTSVNAGATLVQLDQIKSNFLKTDNRDSNQVLVAASASFFGIFKIDASYQHSASKELMQAYSEHRTHSVIETYGGPSYKPQNFSLDQWVDGLDDNLVAIDRSGDPIYYLVTAANLPELPLSVIYELTQYVKNAVTEYYKYNTYKGCTQRDSPNFSFQANVDDGSCERPSTNFTFGGVYQTCTTSGAYPQNLCAGLDQKNPMTGGYSCSDGYEPVLLNTNIKSTAQSYHSCRRCWLLFHCCKDGVYRGSATYSTYWCAANGPIKKATGFMFGGVFTNSVGNPLTNSRSCPLYFYSLKMGANLQVCVSDNYELGLEHALPFAGFFSCRAGNPLKLASDSANHQLKSTKSSHLGSYLKASGVGHWPRGCPEGYSEHLAVVDNGCEINYCIQAHIFSQRNDLPPIRRPPFISLPSNGFQDEKSYRISEDGMTWLTINEAHEENGPETDKQTTSSDSEMSTEGIVAVTFFATLLAFFLVVFAIIRIKKWRRARSGERFRTLGSDMASTQYGSQRHSDQVQIETES